MPATNQRLLGNTGLRVPPIVFDAGVLGNARQVLPEQTRLEICGEWLRRVGPPVFLHVEGQLGVVEASLAFLARALARHEVPPGDVIVSIRVPFDRDGAESEVTAESLLEEFRRAVIALGPAFRPDLAAIELRLESSEVATFGALSAFRESSGAVGVGSAVRHWREAGTIAAVSAAALDWLLCATGPSLIDSRIALSQDAVSPTVAALPIVVGNVFAGDFLVGGNRLHGRVINPLDSADDALISWRKSFVALCHGHGIKPAHACVQFALRQPSVVAVIAQTLHPDLVAESAHHAVTPVPEAFWDALREEGLRDDN